MNILVTGVTGFTGSYIAEHMINSGEVYGTVRGRSRQTEFINHIKNTYDSNSLGKEDKYLPKP